MNKDTNKLYYMECGCVRRYEELIYKRFKSISSNGKIAWSRKIACPEHKDSFTKYIRLTCLYCGKRFKIKKNPGNIIYCSECRVEARRAHDRLRSKQRDSKREDCNMSLQEIADELGVTRERVRQIQNTALKKLKRRMKQYYPDDMRVRKLR